MTLRARRWANRQTGKWALIAAFVVATPWASSQVFVVGEKSATSDVKTDFTPTRVELPTDKLTERGRRELIRNMDAEQGFAHRALPMGPGLSLLANGKLTPGPDDYKKMLYEKGQAAAPGDRVYITAMTIKPDRIIFDLNGGPYAKHRFLSHIQINDTNVVAPQDPATGARITLVFEGGIPEVSAPEIKALLQPVIDFGVKTSDQAYAETLPEPLKQAIASHDVLVGMTHRMVLAAMGGPDSKLRDQPDGDPNGARYEEWIYGHVPQTVKFVRFVGDKVVMVEIAELGKPIQIHDKDEMADYTAPPTEHQIDVGDRKPPAADGGTTAASGPPTLARPGETISVPIGSANGRVQFPDDPKPDDTTKPADPKPDTTKSAPPTNAPSQYMTQLH
jgi:hypothetical protein